MLDVHKDVPVTVMGDQKKFHRVMVNLIHNAIIFAEAGKVDVEVSTVFHSDNHAGLHLKVRGTGLGLSKDQFERAVEPFEQPYDSRIRLAGGTGLGLAISSRLIGMMGGTFWLDTALDTGNTFHFTATFGTCISAASPQLDLNELRGATVLVADADAFTRRTLQQLLSKWQMRPTLAESDGEATELLRTAMEAGSPFDIALVSAQMSGANGTQLTREIRDCPEMGNPVITLLSSINSVSVTELTREFCSCGYLVTPVSQASLLKAVSTSMHTLIDERRALAQATTDFPGKQAHILVAEDNPVNQALAVSILSKEGNHVTVARNGAQVLEAFDLGGIDLILMDVEMPGMTGFEATRAIRLRESQSGQHVTILALTAHAMRGDRERCLEAGMDSYMSKPLQLPELRTTVSQLLSKRENPVPAGQ
jgi:two-component system sensor histidine kinase/response regulator